MTSVTNPFSSLSGSSFFRICEQEEAGGCWSLLRVALTFARGFSSHKNGPGLKQRLANLFISGEAHSTRRHGVPYSHSHTLYFTSPFFHFSISWPLLNLSLSFVYWMAPKTNQAHLLVIAWRRKREEGVMLALCAFPSSLPFSL